MQQPRQDWTLLRTSTTKARAVACPKGQQKAGGYLVQGNNKGSLAHLEEVDGLDGLLFQAMHHVYHQDGNVTQAGPSRPQVGEGLVTCSAPSMLSSSLLCISCMHAPGVRANPGLHFMHCCGVRANPDFALHTLCCGVMINPDFEVHALWCERKPDSNEPAA